MSARLLKQTRVGGALLPLPLLLQEQQQIKCRLLLQCLA